MDYNPDTETKLNFDDTKIRKYLDPDLFIVTFSGEKVNAKLEVGAIKPPNTDLKRFRFAIRAFYIQPIQKGLRAQFTWIYQPLDFEKDPIESENE